MDQLAQQHLFESAADLLHDLPALFSVAAFVTIYFACLIVKLWSIVRASETGFISKLWKITAVLFSWLLGPGVFIWVQFPLPSEPSALHTFRRRILVAAILCPVFAVSIIIGADKIEAFCRAKAHRIHLELQLAELQRGIDNLNSQAKQPDLFEPIWVLQYPCKPWAISNPVLSRFGPNGVSPDGGRALKIRLDYVTEDTDNHVIYGLGLGRFGLIDELGEIQDIELPAEMRRHVRSASGLSYDKSGKRILILSVSGYLVAYDPAGKQWILQQTNPANSFSGLAVDGEKLYFLGRTQWNELDQSGWVQSIMSQDRKSGASKEIRMPLQIAAEVVPPYGRSQINVINGKLAILPNRCGNSQAYFVDPDTGATFLTTASRGEAPK